MPFKSLNNNNLKEINTRNMRMNTDENNYCMNDPFYYNINSNPSSDPSFSNRNQINKNINSKYL